jgi:hypothetical protein
MAHRETERALPVVALAAPVVVDDPTLLEAVLAAAATIIVEASADPDLP